MNEALLVLTTIGNLEQGRRLARELVETRLAACVTCFPGLISFYRWTGKVEEDQEVLLMIKTSAARLDELQAHVLRVHPYEVPEFIVVETDRASQAYLRWLAESTAGSNLSKPPGETPRSGRQEGAHGTEEAEPDGPSRYAP